MIAPALHPRVERALLLSLALVTAGPVIGCSNAQACSSSEIAAVQISVIDGSTQKPICDATVSYQYDGNLTETATPLAGSCDVLLYDGSGAYEQIVVSRAGYQSVTLSTIIVPGTPQPCYAPTTTQVSAVTLTPTS